MTTVRFYMVRLTFTDPVLGAAPKNQNIYADYIASKAPEMDEGVLEEVMSVQESVEKGTTGFLRLPDGRPYLSNHVVKGFFKAACKALRGAEMGKSAKIKNYKQLIDGAVFIDPRQLPLQLAGELGILERSLRASTAQGERVALARSEMAPAGSRIEFQVTALGETVTGELLEEWLDYGQYSGLGQWRNADNGAFVFEIEEVVTPVWERGLARLALNREMLEKGEYTEFKLGG